MHETATNSGDFTMNEASLNSFCDQWFAALSDRDTKAMLALTTENIYWDDTVFWPTPVQGHAELGRYLDTVWKTTPDYEVYEVDRFFNRDKTKGVVLWGQRGSGPKHLASNARFEFQGCDVFLKFENGLLSHYQAAYEINDMCRQLGLIPQRGNKLGAEYLMSLAGAS